MESRVGWRGGSLEKQPLATVFLQNYIKLRFPHQQLLIALKLLNLQMGILNLKKLIRLSGQVDSVNLSVS
jgi:hypothetical protein